MRRAGWVVFGVLLLQCPFCQPAISQSAQASIAKSKFRYGQDQIAEYGRTVAILQRGINENWTREQYLKAFDPPYHPKRAGEDLALRAAIRQAIEWRMPEPEIWDEKPPISVTAAQLIEEYSTQRQLWMQVQSIQAGSKRDPVKLTP